MPAWVEVAPHGVYVVLCNECQAIGTYGYLTNAEQFATVHNNIHSHPDAR